MSEAQRDHIIAVEAERDALHRQLGAAQEMANSIIKEHSDEIAKLLARTKADNAVCICGCPAADHESYGEDGEGCAVENDHQCIRVCRAALEIANGLRAKVDEHRAKMLWQNDFLAGTSLCEGCQKKRIERAIIATPRIQVEEERDKLKKLLRLPLLFHQGGAWVSTAREEWEDITDGKECTTKVMCDAIRRGLEAT